MIYIIIVVFIWLCIVGITIFLLLKRKGWWLGAFWLVLVFITNALPIIPVYLLVEPIIHNYHYTTENGEFNFTEYPEKGKSLEIMQTQFAEYQKNYSKGRDDQLYRTFRMEIFRFWKWKEYLTHPRWKYPYMEREVHAGISG